MYNNHVIISPYIDLTPPTNSLVNFDDQMNLVMLVNRICSRVNHPDRLMTTILNGGGESHQSINNSVKLISL